MPSIKHKTHKGIKKRFKVTATGKVTHKRCGSSHLNSHKSGKQIRRLRKKSVIQTRAVAQRLRRAMGEREGAVPPAHDAPKAAPVASEPTTETTSES
jgi:large subunit ribosomal protein L35